MSHSEPDFISRVDVTAAVALQPFFADLHKKL